MVGPARGEGDPPHGVVGAVPITAVRVRGLAAGVSAHVSRAGYLPATPVSVPGVITDLFLTWLDSAKLRAIDATEPNYLRMPLPAAYPVNLGDGPVPGCLVYVSRQDA